MVHVPRPRSDDGPRPRPVRGQPRPDQLRQAQQHRLGQHPDQVHDPVALEDGPEPVAGPQGGDRGPRRRAVPQPAVTGLEVADPGIGGHDHPRPGHLGPPAEIDVLPGTGDQRVESADGREQVGPHEQAGAGAGEHVAHAVVLFLVQLARLDQGRLGRQLVHAGADRQQPLRTLPLDQLRADDAGVRPERFLHHHPHRVGREGDVVVAEHEVRRALHDRQHVVGRRREPPAPFRCPHVSTGQHAGHASGQAPTAAGVDDEDRQARVVLLGQAGQRLLEPRSRSARHDYGHHRRSAAGHVGRRSAAVHQARDDSPTGVQVR